jgi:hydroxyquinol 1,2-dioxygenase
MNYTEQTLADAVVARLDCEDERFKKVMSSLIRKVHAFVREVEPTEEEWLKLARLVCMSRALRFTRQ